MVATRDGFAHVGRRTFLGGLATLPLWHSALPGAPGAEEAAIIRRQVKPDNLEFPFPSLDSFITPNEQFYVRTHFEVPELSAKSWKLSVEGAVEKPLTLDYDKSRKLPSHTLTALLECSGNSRVFLKPPQVSIRWELGGVSTAERTGVRLSDVLERAGVKSDAVEVILEGADKGEFEKTNPETPGVPYARGLPLSKARKPEVILAYKMNGEDLPASHGYPVRAIAAGWYGMASVKWLKRVIVTDRPFHGYFQSFMYAIWERRHGFPSLVPVQDIQAKSEIARPSTGQIVRREESCRVFGAAWAGEADVAKVEVSTDGGKHWKPASLIGKAVPFVWRFWEFQWENPSAGRHTLMSRATDSQARAQPLDRDNDRRDAVITHVLPIEIEVR